MLRWTDSDNLRSRDALVVGGPSDGLLVAAREQNDRVRYPDVLDLTGYVFDTNTWQFRYDGPYVCDQCLGSFEEVSMGPNLEQCRRCY